MQRGWLGILSALIGCGVAPHPFVDAGRAPVDGGPVTLNQLQDSILMYGCAVSACHSVDMASVSGNLNLDKAHAYSQLINVAASNAVAADGGLVRVKPGDPANSFLWIKVSGPGPGEGNQMPNTGMLLSSDQMNLVQSWIADGAHCTPYSCADLQQTCGDPDDGCGGTHHCGAACP